MKCVKLVAAGPSANRVRGEQAEPTASASSPDLALPLRKLQDTPVPAQPKPPSRRTPREQREAFSASESNLSRQNETGPEDNIPIEPNRIARGDESYAKMSHQVSLATPPLNSRVPSVRNPSQICSIRAKTIYKSNLARSNSSIKKSRSCGVELSGTYSPMDVEHSMMRQIRDIHKDMRSSARIIKDSRARLLEIQKKGSLTDVDIKELRDRHELLLREMERFDRLTRNVQRLVDREVAALQVPPSRESEQDYIPKPCFPCYTAAESAMFHEMKMTHPTVLLGGPTFQQKPRPSDHMRCRSEVDLTRKLSESYDMQEKLVADNADLEVKRYILYKELMTKDQNLETCRAQIKRLQDELKMMSKENATLHERLSKNNPEGDATAINENCNKKNSDSDPEQDSDLFSRSAQQLASNLDSRSSSSTDLEKYLTSLEYEVQVVRAEMADIKKAAEMTSREGGGPGACRSNKQNCYQPNAGGPPTPAMMKACGVCPPCPAPCNPNAPPTPAEREVAKLKIQLRQTEENFKLKVTECAMLRSELTKKKEDLEKERCQHREVANKLRELEMKYEGLQTHTNMLLGTKEQAMEVEVNVRALKQCYREAREEIDELRVLLKEQNEQLQDYRVKYMQAQQLVEEQKRQMDMMDMDNNRISEQINLEIQKVKLKFQEKLQELAPLPDLLKATQMRLKEAQQSQALAEHNAEQLARELNCAREKVHVLMHNMVKPPEKEKEKTDDRQVLLLTQRISQLTDINTNLKQEIERLKAAVIRAEESVLQNERRLQEKMHECAQLGGEVDRARDEAARAIARVNERSETVRKCLQTTIAELERQLAASRAQVRTAEKQREELQCRMNCQIKRLNENFEQAQLRILGLTTQVATLRHGMPSGDGGDEEDEPTECQCKTLFNDP